MKSEIPYTFTHQVVLAMNPKGSRWLLNGTSYCIILNQRECSLFVIILEHAGISIIIDLWQILVSQSETCLKSDVASVKGPSQFDFGVRLVVKKV